MKSSLHLIVKDEVKEVTELCAQASPYFDAIFVTVSDEKAFQELKNIAIGSIHVNYRPWNNRFDEARQHNWDLGKEYDASMWIDADDSFDFTKIPQLLNLLNDFDVVFLPYHYDHDEKGNVIVNLTRERIIKRGKGFYWRGWVHENLISEQSFNKVSAPFPVIHSQTDTHRQDSLERNHKILEEAFLETNDPRYVHYLGISHFTRREFQEAINVLTQYVQVGGWDEEIYRSILKISESYFMLGQIDLAVLEALKAVAILPSYPAAYHLLCHLEMQQDNLKEAIEWGKLALSKPTPPNISIDDPTAQQRTALSIGTCYYQLGEYQKAYAYIKDVTAIDTSEIKDVFQYQAESEVLAKSLPGMYQFYENPQFLWEQLDDAIKYTPLFRKIREELTLPAKWDKNSVVFFCGKGYEEWGPHTLDKGMGGSEEAVVYLAPELAKLGYDVTVFGEVSEPFIAQGVQWLPWDHMDRRDFFNILIIWRTPQFVEQFHARKIFVDMHDQLPEKIVKPYPDVTYLFKSQYHKDQYPTVTDYQIIPNGIDLTHFKPSKKKAYSVIYPSAYYRGAEQLLKLWPKVKEQVPEATLDLYYGWQSWLKLEGEDDFYVRMCQLIKDSEKLGVKEHGRVDHKTLAQKLEKAQVWAYPTEFPEIFCMTAVKANAAGCKPVITDVAALRETGGPNASFVETDSIYRDQYSQEKFVKELVKALKEDNTTIDEQRTWAAQYDWQNVAKQWKNALEGSK